MNAEFEAILTRAVQKIARNGPSPMLASIPRRSRPAIRSGVQPSASRSLTEAASAFRLQRLPRAGHAAMKVRLSELARQHAGTAIETLASIAEDGTSKLHRLPALGLRPECLSRRLRRPQTRRTKMDLAEQRDGRPPRLARIEGQRRSRVGVIEDPSASVV